MSTHRRRERDPCGRRARHLYVSAGTYEPFRPDQQAYLDFDQACGGCLIGKPVAGFRDEHWLDVRDTQGQRTFLLGTVAARVDRLPN